MFAKLQIGNLRIYCAQCDRFMNLPHFEIFLEINLQCNSLIKKIHLTEFFHKNCGGKYFKLPHCVVRVTLILRGINFEEFKSS